MFLRELIFSCNWWFIEYHIRHLNDELIMDGNNSKIIYDITLKLDV